MAKSTIAEKNHIKRKELTFSMIGKTGYYFNKHAKIHRDNIKMYKEWIRHNHFTDPRNHLDYERNKRDEFYAKKETILSILTPCEIHKTKQWKNVYGDEGFIIGQEAEDAYFLYYKVANIYRFHSPLDFIDSKYENLPLKEIDDLYVSSEANNDIEASSWLANNVLKLIESGDYSIVEDDPEINADEEK